MNTQEQLIHEMHDHELTKARLRRILHDVAYDLGVAGQALQKGKVDVTAERIDYVLDLIHKEQAKLAAGD